MEEIDIHKVSPLALLKEIEELKKEIEELKKEIQRRKDKESFDNAWDGY